MSLKRFISSCLKAFRSVQSRCVKRYHLSQRSSMSGVSMRDRSSVTTEVSFLEYDMKLINNNSEAFDNTWNEKMERGWRACSN